MWGVSGLPGGLLGVSCRWASTRPLLRALARPLRISLLCSLLRTFCVCHFCGSRGCHPFPLPCIVRDFIPPGRIGGTIGDWRYSPVSSFGPYWSTLNLITMVGLFRVSKWKRGPLCSRRQVAVVVAGNRPTPLRRSSPLYYRAMSGLVGN